MIALKCQECGAQLKGVPEEGYLICEFCGTINLLGAIPPVPEHQLPGGVTPTNPLFERGRMRRILPPVRSAQLTPRPLGIIKQLEIMGVLPQKEFRALLIANVKSGLPPRKAAGLAIAQLVREGKVKTEELYNALIKLGVPQQRVKMWLSRISE